MKNLVKLLSLFAMVFFAASACTTQSSIFPAQHCGVTFALPPAWTAEAGPPDEMRVDDVGTLACSIALRPRGWSKDAERSRWGTPDPPLTLLVFKSSTSYERALEEIGFEHDPDTAGLRLPGSYGTFAAAEPFSAGRLSGQAAYTFYRGSIRDASRSQERESVFSGEMGNFVMKSESGRAVAFQCDGGSPDMPDVDCEAVIHTIGRSIEFTTPYPRD